MENAKHTPIWYERGEIEATFRDVFTIYRPVLRRQNGRTLSRDTCIARNNLLELSKEILLALETNRILATELLAWMEKVGQERKTEHGELKMENGELFTAAQNLSSCKE